MANPGNREIWDNGVPLNDAWLEFADPDAKRRYLERPTLETFNEQAAATNMQSGGEMLKMFSTGIRQWSDNGRFKKELQQFLLDQLFDDQLHAYGYRIAPSPSRAPVRIAAESFGCASVQWSRGAMTARGRTYSEIQIIDPTTIGDWRKPRHGPKGSGDAIRGAIAAIQNRSVNLSDMPRKAAFDLIRQEIVGPQSKGSGLSDPNLAKYVNEICGSRRIKGN